MVCATLGHLSPTVRRNRMRVVRNFCLYRRRSRPQSFLPDRASFPANHQPSPPYIVTEPDMARILESARSLPRSALCPLRPETLRIAFLLLFTTGMRRGELLRLMLGDIDLTEETVSIRETKFHKSRVIPLSPSVAAETKAYLELRQKNHLPVSVASPLVLSGSQSAEGRGYTGHGLACNWIRLCASLNINTPKGRPPRIHDLRHSFAVNVLMTWYRNGENAQAKLPLLSTYMGHVSVVSTHHYLTFVEHLRSEASALFHRRFGDAIKANQGDAR
jgi:integrase/recombinase XerD